MTPLTLIYISGTIFIISIILSFAYVTYAGYNIFDSDFAPSESAFKKMWLINGCTAPISFLSFVVLVASIIWHLSTV